MKDITRDLKERLMEAEAQHMRIQSELNTVTQLVNSLKALIDAEERRWEQQPLFAGIPNITKGRTPLSRFLISNLIQGPKSVDSLKQEAEGSGLLKDSKYPGRAIHFALVGMKRGGLVEKSNGLWHLKAST